MTEYADRDIIGLRDYYTKHVMAMTAEGLHSKDDIAAELAYRDEKIAHLEARVKDLMSEVRYLTVSAKDQKRRAEIAENQRDGQIQLNCELYKRLLDHIDAHDRERVASEKEWRDEMIKDQGLPEE